MTRWTLHNTLRDRRRSAGMTQQDLATAAGVTRQSIISIERGRHRPSVELALQVARVLECRVEDLFILRTTREISPGPARPASAPQ